MTRRIQMMHNDRTRQVALRVSATEDCPAEEMLVLKPMERNEYVNTLARPEQELIDEIITQMKDIEFAEWLVSCDIRLFTKLPLFGRGVRAVWTKTGNEATGPMPEPVAKSCLEGTLGRAATPEEVAGYLASYPTPEPEPQRELIL